MAKAFEVARSTSDDYLDEFQPHIDRFERVGKEYLIDFRDGVHVLLTLPPKAIDDPLSRDEVLALTDWDGVLTETLDEVIVTGPPEFLTDPDQDTSSRVSNEYL